MNLIDAMPPGLYEVLLTDLDESIAHPELITGRYVAKLESRTLDDIRALGHNGAADQRRFETVARVSEINHGLYRTLLSPIVKAMTTPASAEFMREMHPNRVRFRAFSDRNPLMPPIAQLAAKVRSDRHPVGDDNPLVAFEKMTSSWIVTNLESFAKMREMMTEAMFLGAYGSPLLQAAVGLKPDHSDADRPTEHDLARTEMRADLEEGMERGGFLEAGLRALLYVMRGGGADERQFNALEIIRNNAPRNERVSLSQLKSILRQQAVLLRADESRAMAAIPAMLPDDPGRCKKVIDAITEVAAAKGKLDPEAARRLDEVRNLFGAGNAETQESPRPILVKSK